jgi:hypothetical protein
LISSSVILASAALVMSALPLGSIRAVNRFVV